MAELIRESVPSGQGRLRRELPLMAALALFALATRLLTLMPIHTGVDERDYWYAASALAHGLQYPELTHRTVRFAMILPVAAAQALLGSGPNVYYVLPILNSLLQALLFFALGFRLRGRLAGILTALAIVLFPYSIRTGSQLLPEGFSVTYLALTLLFLLDYFRTGARSLSKLAAAGFWLFIAYEAKITNLFFLPGMALAVLAVGGLSHALVFGVVPLLGFLAETAAYRLFTGYPWGQIQVIAANHLEGNASLKELGFLDLFSRYAAPYLQLYWQIPFLLFAAASLWYLRGRRRGAAPDPLLPALAAPAASFFFCITFAVSSLHPIVPAEPFINRYFSAVLAAVFPILAAAACDLADRVAPLALGRAERSRRAHYAVIAALPVLIALASALLPDRPTLREYLPPILKPTEHPLAQNRAYRALVQDAFNADIPLVASARQGESTGGANALWTCVSYFLDYRLYPDGVRPRPRVEEYRGTRLYVVRRTPAPPDAELEEAIAAVRDPFRLSRVGAADLVHGLTDKKLPPARSAP